MTEVSGEQADARLVVLTAQVVALRAVLRRIVDHPASNAGDLLVGGVSLADLAREVLAVEQPRGET